LCYKKNKAKKEKYKISVGGKMIKQIALTKLKRKKKKQKQKFVYKAKQGTRRLSNKDAWIIGQRVEYLMEKKYKDGITPHEIVKDAEKISSPLHKFFEWEDDIASKKWRVQQARDLLHHIVVVVTIDGIEKESKGFFSVKTKQDEKAYVTLKKAVKKKTYRRQIIGEARAYIRYFDDLLAIIENL